MVTTNWKNIKIIADTVQEVFEVIAELEKLERRKKRCNVKRKTIWKRGHDNGNKDK